VPVGASFCRGDARSLRPPSAQPLRSLVSTASSRGAAPAAGHERSLPAHSRLLWGKRLRCFCPADWAVAHGRREGRYAAGNARHLAQPRPVASGAGTQPRSCDAAAQTGPAPSSPRGRLAAAPRSYDRSEPAAALSGYQAESVSRLALQSVERPGRRGVTPRQGFASAEMQAGVAAGAGPRGVWGWRPTKSLETVATENSGFEVSGRVGGG